MATRTKDPTPAPIREFTDFPLNKQFGFKKIQNFLRLNFILARICRRLINFFNFRK